jgi:cholest-4-en-3-one 26-monooxygenase
LALINMDAPQHTRFRKLVSRGFTPRAIARLRDDLDERARRIAKDAAASGSGDFVEEVASENALRLVHPHGRR